MLIKKEDFIDSEGLKKSLDEIRCTMSSLETIRPRTSLKTRCEYCNSILTSNKCNNCGAPR